MSYKEVLQRSASFGTPDGPTATGLLELAHAGKDVWNDWREHHPTEKDAASGKWIRAADWRHPDRTSISFLTQNIDFSGFNFGDGALFVDTAFGGKWLANFQGATFGEDAVFQSCRFHGGVNFSGTKFGNNATFNGVSFERSVQGIQAALVNFNGAVFGNYAKFKSIGVTWAVPPDSRFNLVLFRECKFGDFSTFNFGSTSASTAVYFDYSSFGLSADFSDSTFGYLFSVDGSKFGEGATFQKAIIKIGVFDKAEFGTTFNFRDGECGQISFNHAKFFGSSDFSNRKFLNKTSFSLARFAMAPAFHQCEFHQDIYFTCEESFPVKPQGTSEASRAYRTLKLAMNKHQATREEQFFFRREMREERKEMWNSRAIDKRRRAIMYFTYEKLSDYGSSVLTPFIWLMGAWVSMACLFASLSPKAELWIPGRSELDLHLSLQWLVYSISNSLPIAGFDKSTLQLNDLLLVNTKSNWYLVLLIASKIIALLFLFLMGLGLRNAFKMK